MSSMVVRRLPLTGGRESQVRAHGLDYEDLEEGWEATEGFKEEVERAERMEVMRVFLANDA